MEKIFFSFIFLFFANLSLLSNDFRSGLISLKLQGGYTFTNYNSDFKRFPGLIDCDSRFTGGGGSGPYVEGGVEVYFTDFFAVSLAIAYTDRSGEIKDRMKGTSRDLNTGEVVNVNSDNRINFTLTQLDFTPGIYFDLFSISGDEPLRLHGGIKLSSPIVFDFVQDEQMISPSGAYFVDNNNKKYKEIELSNGEIQMNNDLISGYTLGIENNLKIGTGLYLKQSVYYDHFFNNVADFVFKPHSYRVSLGISYGINITGEDKPIFIEPEPAPEPEPVPEPVVADIPDPEVELKVTDTDGIIETGNELLATQPLVNAVFFSKGSSNIPDFYKYDLPEDYDPYTGNPVLKHQYIIPVIADILAKNPAAKVRLESSTSGPENEPEGLSLSKARAAAVSEKLKPYGISDERVLYDYRISPRYPSNQDFVEGIEENQRVGIVLINAPMQEYVDIQNYAEVKGNISCETDFANLPAGSEIELSHNLSDEILELSVPGVYSLPFVKRIADTSEIIDISVSLRAADISKLNNVSINLDDLPQYVVDLNLKNFEAILRFDYNSSELSPENQDLLRQLADKLPGGSTIQILGSADALGSAERNIQLERERAGNTKQYIEQIAGNKFTIKTDINIEKFPEATPQGRFLNRSIRIRADK